MKYCSFCGRSEKEAGMLINGIDGCVCTECAAQINKIVNEKKEVVNKHTMEGVMRPTEIKEFLDQYIIGQDLAKERIAVAVYNHYKRINNKNITDDIDIDKSNILLLGETGTGKCLCGNTKVKIRNKNTGEIQEISINDFKKMLNLN